MPYIAAVEVDQRQKLITSTDKLKEILGGSWTIEDTIVEARAILDAAPAVEAIKTVSGELWLRSEQLANLEHVLWQLRECFVRKLYLPCSFAIVEADGNESVGEIQDRLTAEIKRVKNEKAGEMAFPALPWFAPCLIQPDLYANQWQPKIAEHDQHKRRALLNRASAVRFKRGSETLTSYTHRFAEFGEFELPDDLSDFRYGSNNPFIGLIRLDADRSGDVFNSEWSDWKELTKCSEAFEGCLKDALDFAVRETLREAKATSRTFPISPMIAAGEDFLIVARRDLVIPLTFHLIEKYEELANREGCVLAEISDTRRLTLSGGILFARLAYPMSVLNEIVAQLEHSAKALNRTLADAKKEGCVDVYWLDSSARESPLEERKRESRYKHGRTNQYWISSAPWRVSELRAIWDATNTLLNAPPEAKIPRGKWHDIEKLLRLGMPLSGFAWRKWQNGLGRDQRGALRGALEPLQKVSLWPDQESEEPWMKKHMGGQISPYVTALNDIHRIMEMVRIPSNQD